MCIRDRDDVEIETMKKVAETFAGVEHRCELVREIDGVKYYNDSIASSPTRTLAGLFAFEKKVIPVSYTHLDVYKRQTKRYGWWIYYAFTN